jgi:hypothetical protein
MVAYILYPPTWSKELSMLSRETGREIYQVNLEEVC